MSDSARSSNTIPAAPTAVRILAVPKAIPLIVRFLGPVRGLDTHWKLGRSIPCQGSDDCPTSLHRSGIVWKGYAAVESWDASARVWRPAVLELTEGMEEVVHGRDIVGEVWHWLRDVKGDKVLPVAGLYCERHAPLLLSPAFDIVPVLLRLFHAVSLKLDRPNPIPPKVFVEPSSGPAPNLPAAIQEGSVPDNDPEKMEQARKKWKELREEQARRHNAGSADRKESNRER